jgi:hypothetical protein
VTRGSFHWKNGIKDSEVIFSPDKRGRFLCLMDTEKNLQNRVVKTKNGESILLMNTLVHLVVIVMTYGTVGGGGSNGALHGLTKFNMDEAPSNEFFLEYVARPQTAEIFFEEVLMACVFYGMPILIENNKPRLLYHFKNRGYRGFV